MAHSLPVSDLIHQIGTCIFSQLTNHLYPLWQPPTMCPVLSQELWGIYKNKYSISSLLSKIIVQFSIVLKRERESEHLGWNRLHDISESGKISRHQTKKSRLNELPRRTSQRKSIKETFSVFFQWAVSSVNGSGNAPSHRCPLIIIY